MQVEKYKQLPIAVKNKLEEPDEDELRTELRDDGLDASDDEVEEKKSELFQEWLSEKNDEISNISLQG